MGAANLHGGTTMTDYETTTTRQSTAPDPRVVDPVVAPASSSVRTTERAYVPAGPSVSTTLARFVTFIFGVLQALLILRIVLLLLVANHSNDIVALILNVTDPFIEPFRGMFSLDRIKADQGSVFDFAALVALIGWTLIEMLILAALRIFDRRTTTA
jgi:uncharacterized protein YggT (Ycf19 family)